MHDESFERFLQLSRSPAALDYGRRVHEIAGYSLSPALRMPFDDFDQWWRVDPEPRSLAMLRPEAGRRLDFRQAMLNGFSDAQQALTAAVYHLDRACKMDDQLSEAANASELQEILSAGIAIGGGNTIALDEEYQTFVLALRRTLEYLAVGCAAFFRAECHSFRNLQKVLRRASPSEVADQVLAAFQTCCAGLGKHIEDDNGKSIRSRIMHYRFVKVGSPNVRGLGYALVGGPEDLEDDHYQRIPLRQVLDSYLCVTRDFISACVAALTTYEPSIEGAV